MADAALFDLGLWYALMDLLPVVIEFMTAFFIIDLTLDVLDIMGNIAKRKKIKKAKRKGDEFVG